MSDVLENDYFGRVQNTPLESPHLAAVPTDSLTPPNIISIDTFTDLGHNATNREVHGLIEQNSKWLFGYQTAGADTPATPESRMKGLRNILAHFEQYSSYQDSTPADLVKRSRLFSTNRDFRGKKAPITELLGGREEYGTTAIFWELVGKKDPLIVALAQIGESHKIGQSIFNKFMNDSIIAFHYDEIKSNIDQQLAQLRKSIGKTAIASE